MKCLIPSSLHCTVPVDSDWLRFWSTRSTLNDSGSKRLRVTPDDSERHLTTSNDSGQLRRTRTLAGTSGSHFAGVRIVLNLYCLFLICLLIYKQKSYHYHRDDNCIHTLHNDIGHLHIFHVTQFTVNIDHALTFEIQQVSRNLDFSS